MYTTSKLIAEQGLPQFFLDGTQKYSFNADKIFQDFYILGKETHEYDGKAASDLTDKALVVIATHKQADSISRQEVHQVITDLLYMNGFANAATYVQQRQQLPS